MRMEKTYSAQSAYVDGVAASSISSPGDGARVLRASAACVTTATAMHSPHAEEGACAQRMNRALRSIALQSAHSGEPSSTKQPTLAPPNTMLLAASLRALAASACRCARSR